MLFKNKLLIIGCVLSAVLFLQGCNKDWDEHYNTVDATTEKDKIISELEKIPNISKFTEAVKQVDTLVDLLSQNRLYTVFAPVNETFDPIYSAYSDNDELLAKMIMYHFIDGKYKYKDFTSGWVTSFSNKYLNISVDGANQVMLDKTSSITEPDNLSLNGMIHIVDEPLVPLFNLYEMFKYTESLTTYQKAVLSYTIKDFNVDKSTPLLINDAGDVVYDSVFNETNPFLIEESDFETHALYGANIRYVNISDEDKIYTCVIPENIDEAIAEVKTNPALNGTISDYDLVGPILVNFIYSTWYTTETLVTSIRAYHENPKADTSLIHLHFADLMEFNLSETVSLSNGLVHIVDGLEYNLAWLITDQGNIGEDEKETEYRNNLFASTTYSENVDTVLVNSKNIKTVFYESENADGYNSKYNEWVNFELKGEFYPVDYNIMVRSRNVESGKFKVEVNDDEIGTYDFSTMPSGDNDNNFDKIGKVSFTEKKSDANLKFTFVGTHSGTNKGNQNLWIREIKLVPVLK